MANIKLTGISEDPDQVIVFFNSNTSNLRHFEDHLYIITIRDVGKNSE
jgi:hypothetical protein